MLRYQWGEEIMISNNFLSRNQINNTAKVSDKAPDIKFPILVLSSQLLLLALAIAWFVHMVLIAVHGKIFFAEPNPLILYGEITATVLIALFAIIVFVFQWKRSWRNLGK